MQLKLLLPRVEPSEFEEPGVCPNAQCGGRRFQLRQEVRKPVCDSGYSKVTARRYECLRCGWTFHVYALGTNDDHISRRLEGLAGVFYIAVIVRVIRATESAVLAEIGIASSQTGGTMAISRSLIEELRDFDTALLANTIGYIDSTPAHEYYMGGSIRSVTPTLGPTAGVAVTCELDSSSPGGQPDTEGYSQQLEQISRMDVPVVWVVKTVGSRPDHECVLGDGMAKSLYSIGCVGAVTDGGVRDIPGLLTVPFAVYSRGVTIHHTALRFRRMNEPVEIGGIVVRTGDMIHANAEGVIKIPASCLAVLPAKAILMRAFEHEVHLELRRTDVTPAEKRARTAEALAKYGFAGH
jgi:4-hydroxy-4-methyl-2-oxoglutarate aldolase